MAPGPGCTLSWCVPRGTAPTRASICPASPVLDAVHARHHKRQVKITCSMRTALLVGTPTTSATVTASTGATEGCSSKSGKTAKLTLLITAAAPLAMCIMDRIASAAKQQNYALRLRAAPP